MHVANSCSTKGGGGKNERNGMESTGEITPFPLFTALPRTQPIRGVKRSIFHANRVCGSYYGGLTAQIGWFGLRVGGHPALLSLHSSNEPGELSK